MLRAVFGVDPKLSKEFFVNIEDNKTYNPSINIKFDTGEKEIFENSNSTIIANSFKIPINASKIFITSDNDITSYGFCGNNPAIVSIEEFTSDSIIDCDSTFCGFTNVREIKNINLNWNRIETAHFMCANWKSFDGILPENFCSDMISLRYASSMFSGWKSYNQRLPNRFCYNMFNLTYADYMFKNWNSYSFGLPYPFFVNTSYFERSLDMFWGWLKCDNTPKYKLPKYIHDYKQKDVDELNELLKKEEVIDYQLMSKLTDKEFVLCIKGNIDHYIFIYNGNITCLYDRNKNCDFFIKHSIEENTFIVIK